MVKIIHVKPIMNTDEVANMIGKRVDTGYFKQVIDYDCDVIDETGKYLARFRKGVFDMSMCEKVYNNIYPVYKNSYSHGNRPMASGKLDDTKAGTSSNTVMVNTNIAGFFDTLGPSHKKYFKEIGDFDYIKGERYICRETAFNSQNVNEYDLLGEWVTLIDTQYNDLFPHEHSLQKALLDTLPNVKIKDTAFSTITINLNFQTLAHSDAGDFTDGFGNLVVCEGGSSYTGGFTGFPEYGVAIDCRMGDFLGMNVHKLHCNEPIISADGEHQRLSFVCYLREGLSKCKNKDKILKLKDMSKYRKKFMADKERYVIAIVSHKRSKILNKKTLSMLNREGIDKDRIYVFVDECEMPEYYADLNKDYYNKLVKGGTGIIKQVEAIEEYFADGAHVVRIDDDIDEVIMNMSCFNGATLDTFFKSAFSTCKENNAYIWGVYPVNNDFFMIDKPEVNFNLSFICGNFYGFINRPYKPRTKLNTQFRLTRTIQSNGNKEDIERTLRYWINDGIIVRFDRITTKTKYYGTDGGGLGKFNDRIEPMRIATEALLEEFSDYGSKYIKPNGMTEFRFKKQKNSYGINNIMSYEIINE